MKYACLPVRLGHSGRGGGTGRSADRKYEFQVRGQKSECVLGKPASATPSAVAEADRCRQTGIAGIRVCKIDRKNRIQNRHLFADENQNKEARLGQ